MKLVSIIIPVKGRLEHLKQSLPVVFRQTYKPTEVIVVDYNDPDHAALWVAENTTSAIPLRVHVDSEEWNLSAARNVGITYSHGGVLWFLDADALPPENFLTRYVPVLTPTSFIASPSASILVEKQAAVAAGGFNEVLEGWGYEDVDFFHRLSARGMRHYQSDSVNPIRHDDSIRNTYHGNKKPLETLIANHQATGFRGL